MNVLSELNESLLSVTTVGGVLDAVETAYQQLSDHVDSLAELLACLMTQVTERAARVDNCARRPSAYAEEAFVNSLKDDVDEWIIENR